MLNLFNTYSVSTGNDLIDSTNDSYSLGFSYTGDWEPPEGEAHQGGYSPSAPTGGYGVFWASPNSIANNGTAFWLVYTAATFFENGGTDIYTNGLGCTIRCLAR